MRSTCLPPASIQPIPRYLPLMVCDDNTCLSSCKVQLVVALLYRSGCTESQPLSSLSTGGKAVRLLRRQVRMDGSDGQTDLRLAIPEHCACFLRMTAKPDGSHLLLGARLTPRGA